MTDFEWNLLLVVFTCAVATGSALGLWLVED